MKQLFNSEGIMPCTLTEGKRTTSDNNMKWDVREGRIVVDDVSSLGL